ncbi:MAG TPA: adenylate kinase [Candidatus Eisenbacteria bacterium]|nr:adenylate kinase [Candidatus Eisenbacteria bacterium]
MRVALLGPPGVGKGTQGRRLACERGWALVSTGEMLRDAVARRTPLGLEAAHVLEQGLLVPDDVMVGLVRERTLEPDARTGFVLDGFPRTVPQAEALDGFLGERGQELDVVVALTAPDEELVRRLSARWECPVCRRVYNTQTAPAKDGRHCDDHPTVALRQRADDTEETVRRRLGVYREQTAPLVSFYRGQGRLREVPGTGTVEGVHAALARAVTG